MKKFGSWSEQVSSKLRTSSDNKEVTITPPTTLAGASNAFLTPNIPGTSDVMISRISDDTGASRLQTKDLSTDNVRFTHAGDTSKKLAFDISAVSGVTTLVIPAGNDSLVTLTATQTLTNKTLTLPKIMDTSSDHKYNILVSELLADRNITIPLLISNDTFVFNDHIQELKNKTIDSDLNTITNIVNADIKAAAAIAIDKLAALTASRALASNASGFITASAVTAVELGYLSGVTSAVQTQINSKITEVMTTRGDLIYRNASNITARLPVGSAGQVLATDGVDAIWQTLAGTGDVSSTLAIADNRIVRGDGGAKGVQQSLVTIDDSGNMTGVVGITATGNIDTSERLIVDKSLEIGTTASAISSANTDYRSLGNKKASLLITDAPTTINDMYLFGGAYYDGTNRYSTNLLTGSRFMAAGRSALTQTHFEWAVAKDIGGAHADTAATYTSVGFVDGNGKWTLGSPSSAQAHLIQGNTVTLTGTGETALKINAPSANNAVIYLQENSVDKWFIYNSQVDDSLIIDSAGAAPSLVISQAGLLTLGETGETGVHQINGDIYLTEGLLLSDTGATRKTYATLQLSKTTNPELLFEDIGNNTANIALRGANFIIASDSSTPITFKTGATFTNGAVDGTERMRLTAAGQFLVGATSARANIGNINTPLIQMESISNTTRFMSITQNSDNAQGPILYLAKSGAASLGSSAVVLDNAELGVIVFGAGNNTSIRDSAYIIARANGASTATSVASDMEFYTTPTGTLTPTLAMNIDPSGNITMPAGNLSVTGTATLTSHLNVDSGTLYVDATNNRVGINDASPAYALDVGAAPANGTPVVEFTNNQGTTATTTILLRLGITTDLSPVNGMKFIEFQNDTGLGATTIGSISQASASSVAYNTTSDERLKSSILPITYGLQSILDLHPVKFNWTLGNQADFGFIAQEVALVIPEAVRVPTDETQEYWSMEYAKIVPILVKAVQELSARIVALENP